MSCWRFTVTSWPDLHRQLQEQRIPTPRSLQQPATPLPFWYKRSLNSSSEKMVLWDTSPPSSQSAGFLNKVIIQCPNSLSLDVSACCVVSRTRLDSVASWDLPWPSRSLAPLSASAHSLQGPRSPMKANLRRQQGTRQAPQNSLLHPLTHAHSLALSGPSWPCHQLPHLSPVAGTIPWVLVWLGGVVPAVLWGSQPCPVPRVFGATRCLEWTDRFTAHADSRETQSQPQLRVPSVMDL